jgi:hypothetical protein
MAKRNLVVIGFALCLGLHILAVQASAQPGVDRYTTTISTSEEKYRLDKFAIYLSRDPDLIGYICFFEGTGTKSKTARERAKKARSYLVKKHSFRGKRIKLINGGERPEPTILLQGLPSWREAPNFYPDKSKGKGR